MKTSAANLDDVGVSREPSAATRRRLHAVARRPHTALHRVAVASGDGVGPEIMEAALRVLEAAHAPLELRPIRMGLACWGEGNSSGIPAESWDAIRATGVLLKGPMSAPQGGGMKGLNATLHKSLGLFANVRPVRSLAPWIRSNHPGMDLVVIRENEADRHAGIEHRSTDDMVHCLKRAYRPGCERIVRYAFEYARTRSRRRLTCMTNDTFMELTDGLFHRVFDEIAAEYPEIESEHMIAAIGMARAAADPERFDVILTPDPHGDILSDVFGEISGSVGMTPSANIGHHAAVFEAIHGSAPDIAGRDVANPSGLLLSAAKMLAHLGEGEVAELIHNAWLRTIEDGVHTADVFRSGVSSERVGTQAFAAAVIERLGAQPRHLRQAVYPRERLRILDPVTPVPARKEPVGTDVFVQARCLPELLARKVNGLVPAGFRLQMITNRGVQVWPAGLPETFCTDQWRCRFVLTGSHEGAFTHKVIGLLDALTAGGIDWVKTEHLYTFDGVPGDPLGQGQ